MIEYCFVLCSKLFELLPNVRSHNAARCKVIDEQRLHTTECSAVDLEEAIETHGDVQWVSNLCEIQLVGIKPSLLMTYSGSDSTQDSQLYLQALKQSLIDLYNAAKDPKNKWHGILATLRPGIWQESTGMEAVRYRTSTTGSLCLIFWVYSEHFFGL